MVDQSIKVRVRNVNNKVVPVVQENNGSAVKIVKLNNVTTVYSPTPQVIDIDGGTF